MATKQVTIEVLDPDQDGSHGSIEFNLDRRPGTLEDRIVCTARMDKTVAGEHVQAVDVSGSLTQLVGANVLTAPEAAALRDTLKKIWNAFVSRETT